jgi:molybdopterin molybdotransferase
MLRIEEALLHILAQAERIDRQEIISIDDAVGRIITENQYSAIDAPPQDNSAMDGYALSSKTVDSFVSINGKVKKITLPVSQTIPAGSPPTPLEPNTVARIFTGAEIPAGADTVVMQENCERHDNLVTLTLPITTNDNVRSKGQDLTSGGMILSKDRCLQPQDIGLLATAGIAKISVYQRLRVAIISTGNELTEPGQALAPGQIYNSNRYLLKSFLRKMDIEVIDLGTTDDSSENTQSLLAQAANAADCIITTGGVSVGDEDHVKQAIEQLGSLDLWKIAIKPGKPLAFGEVNNVPVFGLPGNPVSVFVTFLLLVRPFLLTQQGHEYQQPNSIEVTANFHWPENISRQEYLRVIIHDNKADIVRNQSSGVLSAVVAANGLAVVPPGTSVKPGKKITVIPFDYWY